MTADLEPALITFEDLPPLFHWSPVARRKQIERYGLRPRMRHTVHTTGWRAPYVCLAESPSWAWALSGMAAGVYGSPGGWDLWQVNANGLTGMIIDSGDDQHRWHEVRPYERVYKSRIWYVATREVAT